MNEYSFIYQRGFLYVKQKIIFCAIYFYYI